MKSIVFHSSQARFNLTTTHSHEQAVPLSPATDDRPPHFTSSITHRLYLPYSSSAMSNSRNLRSRKTLSKSDSLSATTCTWIEQPLTIYILQQPQATLTAPRRVGATWRNKCKSMNIVHSWQHAHQLSTVVRYPVEKIQSHRYDVIFLALCTRTPD